MTDTTTVDASDYGRLRLVDQYALDAWIDDGAGLGRHPGTVRAVTMVGPPSRRRYVVTTTDGTVYTTSTLRPCPVTEARWQAERVRRLADGLGRIGDAMRDLGDQASYATRRALAAIEDGGR